MSQTPAQRRIVIAPGHYPGQPGARSNGLVEYSEAVKLPWFSEIIDGKVLRVAVNLLIAQAVSMMNRMGRKRGSEGVGERGSEPNFTMYDE